MRKIYWIIILAIFIALISRREGHCSWPINKTLPIEGRVTDATTGKPIENVVVSCVWWKQYLLGLPGGTQRKRIASEYSITDKDGRYKISGKTSFHILSTFNALDMYINHPLYEGKTIWGFYLKPMGSEEWIYRDEHNKRLDLVSKNGVVYYNLSLLSLEEKYKIDQKTKRFINEKMKPIDFYAEIESHDTAFYWITLNKYNILYNIEDVFRNWQNIAEKFPSGASYKYLKDLRNKIENNLRSKK